MCVCVRAHASVCLDWEEVLWRRISREEGRMLRVVGDSGMVNWGKGRCLAGLGSNQRTELTLL